MCFIPSALNQEDNNRWQGSDAEQLLTEGTQRCKFDVSFATKAKKMPNTATAPLAAPPDETHPLL